MKVVQNAAVHDRCVESLKEAMEGFAAAAGGQGLLADDLQPTDKCPYDLGAAWEGLRQGFRLEYGKVFHGGDTITKAFIDRVEKNLATFESFLPAQPGDNQPSHSPDFTSVNWFGTRYTFTKGNQAESVRVLWEAWESGGHSLSQETIGKRVDSGAYRFELAKVFRKRKGTGERGYEPHPAWGTMIGQDSKGSYRLAPPESA